MEFLYILVGVVIVLLKICANQLFSIVEASNKDFPEVSKHGFWWGLAEGLMIVGVLAGVYYFFFQ